MEIRYENVSKRFDGVPALGNFDIRVPDGTFLVLLGPSGCGKTTAMRIAAGLEQPTEGRVFIGDRDVTDMPPRSRDIAMVFQSYALYPQMTVAENIGYPLRIRKTPKTRIKSEVERVAAALDLEPYLARKPRALSGGQRQRVALARAIIRKPVAFLMDEPLSNLDAQLRASMRTEIKRLQREFVVTTLYVTHDQVEAMTMADQVAILKHGVLQQLAPPQTLYAEPANTFVAKFVGSPPMNIINGSVTDGLFRSDAGTLHTASDWRGSVQLGFRPEAVALTEPTSAVPQLKGVVYAVEPLGNELIVAFQVGTEIVHARLAADTAVQVGQNCGLRIEAPKVHLFDPTDGTRIAGTTKSTTDNLVSQREMA